MMNGENTIKTPNNDDDARANSINGDSEYSFMACSGAHLVHNAKVCCGANN